MMSTHDHVNLVRYWLTELEVHRNQNFIYEIKMKSWALLSSHLPNFIDRSNLSPSRKAPML